MESWVFDPILGRDRSMHAHVERRAEEGREWAAACAKGDCVYACADCAPRSLRDARRYIHEHGCPGYITNKYIEHGEPLVRSRVCERRMTWARKEAEKERRRKAELAAQDKGKLPPPKSWSGE